jgi:hypothetical protein
MKKASILKVASKLRELTSYATVRENDTRWSSTFQMIDRYLRIQNELSSVVDLLSLLPNHLEVDFLTRAHTSMKQFDSVTLMLQRDGMTFVESRQIFDLFLKDFPDFDHYIGDTAAIIEDQVFEKAVMQIARALPLSEELQNAAQVLIRPEDPVDKNAIPVGDNADEVVTTESYSQELQRKLKRQKRETSNEKANMYMNLDMLPGTSVNCERLFSAAKFILSDTRKRTTPSLFEALLLLKVNRGFWNVYSVGQAMGRTTSDVDKNTSNEVESDDESVSGAFY